MATIILDHICETDKVLPIENTMDLYPRAQIITCKDAKVYEVIRSSHIPIKKSPSNTYTEVHVHCTCVGYILGSVYIL